MKKIGLTGGIGVGKTYVSKIFNQMGIPIFNADEQAKKCMVEDTDLKAAIQLSFGENMYINGTLQKDALAEIVFSNSESLAMLNTLVHPVVKQKFENWCNMQSNLMVIKEAAILFESDAHLGLDVVVCVSAPEKLRITRVQNRDASSIEQIESRMSKQMPQAEKEELADFLIFNDEVQLLLPQVLAIIKEME